MLHTHNCKISYLFTERYLTNLGSVCLLILKILHYKIMATRWRQRMKWREQPDMTSKAISLFLNQFVFVIGKLFLFLK